MLARPKPVLPMTENSRARQPCLLQNCWSLQSFAYHWRCHGLYQRVSLNSHLSFFLHSTALDEASAKDFADIRLASWVCCSSQPGAGARPYVLQTTFPSRDLTDLKQTVKDAGLLSSVVVCRNV